MSSAVIVSLRVPADPARAFTVFTEEIGAWWLANPLFMITRQGDGTPRFEEGPEGWIGGRLVTDLPDGRCFEIGPIIAWEAGERLVVGWRQESFAANETTELEVRFEPAGDETRITVEHRGWGSLPQAHPARHGFPLLPFQQRAAEHWQALLRRLGRRRADP